MCGTRGSTPAPGPAFVRYGGHTSCIALAHGDEPPPLVIDAGTGIRNVPELLRGRPFRDTLLVTHLRWDYTQVLPFFRAGDDEDASIRLLMPAQE